MMWISNKFYENETNNNIRKQITIPLFQIFYAHDL